LASAHSSHTVRPETKPSGSVVRVGLDIGTFETRIVLPRSPLDAAPRVLTLPTLVGYTKLPEGGETVSCVGKSALMRRDRTRVENPLLDTQSPASSACADFARHLRRYVQRRGERAPWGCVACAAEAPAKERGIKRAIANGLFERVVLTDPALLAAMGTGSSEALHHSVVIDVGRTSIRAALVQGRAPSASECFQVPSGGDHLDAAIRTQLVHRCPELLLTDHTLTALKNHLAFVRPVRRRAKVSLHLGGTQRELDVTDIIEAGCAQFFDQLLKAVRRILDLCPSDKFDAFQSNIYLIGGGAEVQGLARRLQQELRSGGLDLVRVVKPVNSTSLVAKGAYLWASRLQEAQWSIPLFAFGA
jgi:actin-like ATPase involved in cell morphogenesis